MGGGRERRGLGGCDSPLTVPIVVATVFQPWLFREGVRAALWRRPGERPNG